MKLGMLVGYSGRKMNLPMEAILHAEGLGYDSVWTSEAYGSDAVTPAAWILANTKRIKVGTAIMQMPGRTPAMAAMTAMSLAQLSGNRFIVGVGASGPQVVEGWHGVPYGRPVTRLKEYVAIMKRIFAREGELSFNGKEYQIPYAGPGATGLGKPLKSILHCEQPIPIYAATITPAGVAAAAEVADGFFPVWMDPEQYSVFAGSIEKGSQPPAVASRSPSSISLRSCA
jgi:F420-dependent oxidoreductase-like protein